MSERDDSASTDPDRLAREMLASLAAALEPCGEQIALIGGMAFNVHREPRFTDDIDFMALPEAVSRIRACLRESGFEQVHVQGEEQPSGPDHLRFRRPGTPVAIEFLVSKTEFQDVVVQRAVAADQAIPIRIATPEDLVVLKMIANRSQDHRDLLELGKIEGLDWGYIERWAPIWDLEERLEALRGWLEHDRQI